MFQRDVFVPVNLQANHITVREYASIMEMYNRSMSTWSPQGYIYLRSDPVKCSARIRQRSRTSEEVIAEDYIVKLHELHEVAYNTALANNERIVVIDVDKENTTMTVPEVANEIMNALRSMDWNKTR